jgi:non-ribosomal peptide synthetase component E (peptide arylation enzyme)
MNTADHVDRLAAHRPAAIALVDEATRLTWGEVAHRSRRLAAALAGQGLARDTVVYTQLPSTVELFLLRLACERAGLKLVTVPPAFRQAEVARIVDATKPALAVVAGTWRGTDFRGLLASASPGLPVLTLTRWDQGARDTLEALEAGAPTDLAGVLARRAYGADETSQLGTTSGSTGTPKLIEVTIGARLRTAGVQTARYGVRADDTVLALTPLITGTADALGYHGAPQVGFRLVVTEHFDAERAVEAIVTHGATVVIGVPTMAMRLLAAATVTRIPRGAVRIYCSHGAVFARSAAAQLEARLGCRVMQAYGAFEYGGICATSHDDPDDVRLGTVGRPLDGNELVVLDDCRAPVARGDVGRLHVRGAHANAGYWRAPQLTQAAWRDGYFDLMEIGRQDARGNVTILGRARDLIIRGGQNIFPAEVEELIARHPDVVEASVIGLPDPTLGEIACACVVLRAGVALTGELLVAFLEDQGIAAFKLPERFEVFDGLPTLATGHKVDRQKLVDEVLQRGGPI